MEDAGFTFESDMLTWPLGGCNMLLGIQWLISLSDVLRSFKKLKMAFSVKGHKVSLRGMQPPDNKVLQ